MIFMDFASPPSPNSKLPEAICTAAPDAAPNGRAGWLTTQPFHVGLVEFVARNLHSLFESWGSRALSSTQEEHVRVLWYCSTCATCFIKSFLGRWWILWHQYLRIPSVRRLYTNPQIHTHPYSSVPIRDTLFPVPISSCFSVVPLPRQHFPGPPPRGAEHGVAKWGGGDVAMMLLFGFLRYF